MLKFEWNGNYSLPVLLQSSNVEFLLTQRLAVRNQVQWSWSSGICFLTPSNSLLGLPYFELLLHLAQGMLLALERRVKSCNSSFIDC